MRVGLGGEGAVLEQSRCSLQLELRYLGFCGGGEGSRLQDWE